MSKKKKKNKKKVYKSVNMMKAIDKTMNKNYQNLIDEIEYYQ